MWKLKITRKYTYQYNDGMETTMEDKHLFKVKTIEQLSKIIDNVQEFGIEGEYSYEIVFEEGEK